MKLPRPSATATAAPVLLAVLALGATACQDNEGVDQDRSAASTAGAEQPEQAQTGPARKSPSPGASHQSAPQETGGPRVGQTQAARSAEESVDGGRVTSLELQDSGKVWKVDVMTAEPRVHHVKVDATTGALLGSVADRMPDHARKRLNIPLSLLDKTSVDRDAAASKALEKAGKGFVSALSVQGRGESPHWEVKVRVGRTVHEVDVDAKDGRVRESRIREASSGSRNDDERSRDDRGERAEWAEEGKERVRERSGDFGRDYYNWEQHTPR
ncbi:PepSY domain-containing protein [Streptomyces sp. NPDC087440]|uniref:PepSY domain-containing protein n=1 Tax=Streptomyces sp. NPDC087440 TaxID=3365790 RepID=UPI003802E56B